MANRIITAAVSGETIKLSNKLAGAAGSFNAVSLAFTFDSSWDGTTKKVYFLDRDGANAVYRLLTLDLFVNGAYIVPIPAEPLVYAGEMTVTIKGIDFATDGTTAERIIMSASTTMKVSESNSPVTGTVPVEPTPTQTEQLQAEIDDIKDCISGAEQAVIDATAAKIAAQTAQSHAETAETNAETAQGLAEAAKTSAESTVAAFDTHAASVTSTFNSNATSKTNTFNDNATAANATIDGKVTLATNAASASQSAQGLSESARDLSISAKNDAQTAKTAAELAETHAKTSETNSKTSETNSKTSETNAGLSALGASGSATDANNAKLAAQTAQTNAETAEAHAELAETNAETAESNATAKATLAESYAKGGTGTRSGEDTDNAKYYKEQASAIAGGDYPTKTEAFNVDNHVSGTTNKVYTATEQTKLSGIATGATANTGTVTSITAGTGLSGGAISTSGTIAVNYGTTDVTACVGNDARLSDARTPSSHVHGNITNAGAIGTTASLPVVTTTSGVLTTSTAQAMGGLLGDGYGTCATAAGTAAKAVTCSGFALVTGGYVAVKFTNTDTSTTPTLNVNSTGAKSIYYNGATITAGMINSALTAYFVYNGTQYELLNPMPATIVPVATTSVAGLESAADKTKLDGIATGATAYSHPTGDGNLHVPATSTTNSGKVLTAGATAGSLSWVAPSGSYVQLLTTTVGTAAASISLDLSSLSTGDYASLIVYATPLTPTGTTINCTVNSIVSGYYGSYFASGDVAITPISNGLNFGAFPTNGGLYHPIRLEITNSFISSNGYANISFSGGYSVSNGNFKQGACIVRNDAVISSIQFASASGTISVGSVFRVYGVKK